MSRNARKHSTTILALVSAITLGACGGGNVSGDLTTAALGQSGDAVITMAANCFNSALDAAVNEYQERGKIFSPQNWLKAKDSLLKVQQAVKLCMSMIGNAPGGPALKKSYQCQKRRCRTSGGQRS